MNLYGRRSVGWMVGVMLAWFSVGCQSPAGWFRTEEPTAVPAGTLLFSDDFSQVPTGWGISESADAAVAYEREGLRILVSQPGKDAWSVAGKKYADVAVTASARRLSGPENNMIGLICRFQDRSNFYLSFMSSDGYYGIAKIEQDSFDLISAEQLQYNSALLDTAGENKLEMRCSGDQLVFSVNDMRLAQARDDAFIEGDVGVFTGAYDQPGVDIVFDNFEVRQP